MKTFEQFQGLVREWARSRDILKLENTSRQIEKIQEELNELDNELFTGCLPAEWSKPQKVEKIMLEIGDLITAATTLACQLGYDVEECVTLTWAKIKDRKGKLVDGTFVKEDDLPLAWRH